MQTIENSFSTVTTNIGFGKVAELADVGYQAVSRFASDPRPGHKYHIRRRILSAVISEATRRVDQLRKEAAELETTITELESWRERSFGK